MFVKKSRLSFTFLLIPLLVTAQPRHSKGLGMIGVGYGYNKSSTAYTLSYQRYLSDVTSIKGGFDYTTVKFNVSKYQAYSINPEVYYTLFSNFRNIYFNSKAAAVLGFETLDNEVFSKKNNLFFGESLGCSLELFLDHWIKAELGIEQRFLQKSLASKYNTKVSLGISILIN